MVGRKLAALVVSAILFDNRHSNRSILMNSRYHEDIRRGKNVV